MNVPPALEKIIQEKVSSGGYASPEAVLHRALEILDETDREIERIRQRNLFAIEQLNRGEGIPVDEAFEELYERNRRFHRESA